jgi:hypothetical protein
MMKQAKLLFLLIAALAFASCRPTAQQTAAGSTTSAARPNQVSNHNKQRT